MDLSPGSLSRQQFSVNLYSLLGQQVRRYHQHYHMGDNSSVPAQTAQELLQSILYTLETAGSPMPDQDLQIQLAHDQAILAQRLAQARRQWHLVSVTAPDWQSQCHWETIAILRRYLDHYDHLHFAHRVPQDLDYPLLTPPPEALQGIVI